MKAINILIIFSILLISSGCSNRIMKKSCTGRLWKYTDTERDYWVSEKTITEEELIKNKVKYRKGAGGFFIEKSQLRKVSDNVLKVVGTPVTIVTDGLIVIGLVAGVLAYGFLENAAKTGKYNSNQNENPNSWNPTKYNNIPNR